MWKTPYSNWSASSFAHSPPPHAQMSLNNDAIPFHSWACLCALNICVTLSLLLSLIEWFIFVSIMRSLHDTVANAAIVIYSIDTQPGRVIPIILSTLSSVDLIQLKQWSVNVWKERFCVCWHPVILLYSALRGILFRSSDEQKNINLMSIRMDCEQLANCFMRWSIELRMSKWLRVMVVL